MLAASFARRFLVAATIARGGEMTSGEKEYVAEKVGRWDEARERFLGSVGETEVAEWVRAGGD